MSSASNFFPIISNNLRTTFPELRHYILTNYSHSSIIKKGREIKFHNDSEFIYLASGKVKTYLCDVENNERMLYIFLKDTLVFQSVSELIAKSMLVAEDASVYYIDKMDLFTFLQTDPVYISKYADIISSRYGVLMQQILSNNNQCAKQKVKSFLLTFARKYGETQADGSIIIGKFPSLTDIGQLTNVHRTNVSACVNELEALNIISRQDHQLIVNDLEALADN